MRGAQNKKVPNESVALLTLNTNAKKKLENMRMSAQYDIKEKCKNYWKLEKSRLGHAYVYELQCQFAVTHNSVVLQSC